MTLPINQIVRGAMPEATKVFPDGYFNCSISSPPYWALRDYGTATWEGGEPACDHKMPRNVNRHNLTDKQHTNAGSAPDIWQKCGKCGANRIDKQLGLEPTFEEYIDKLCTIYDEVKRVLRPDGTCFVNLGDTYVSNPSGKATGVFDNHFRTEERITLNKPYQGAMTMRPAGVQAKSLCLIPQRFAIEMCRQRGKYIKSRENQVWLAALIDGEGCIAVHRRTKGRKNPTYGATLSIYNTCKELIDKAQSITGGIGSRHIKTDSPRNSPVYEWRVMSNNAKDVLRDVYPHLIAKKYQARAIIYCPSSGKDAEECWLNIKAKNQFGSPTREYPEPRLGSSNPWILRNTIIWKKPNPMPSSAKDRFTVDFEYVYFFVKSNAASYYIHPRKMRSSWTQKYDYMWVHRNNGLEVGYQPFSDRLCKGKKRLWNRRNLWEGRDYWFEPQHEPHIDPKGSANRAKYIGHSETSKRLPRKDQYRPDDMTFNPLGRNKRTVWTIPTQPYPDAHFATFPEKLVEPMIKAGCPEFVCKKCGKAREKIYNEEKEYHRKPNYKSKTASGSEYDGKFYSDMYNNIKTFKGYADCGCGADWRPGIVLDMFRRQWHYLYGCRAIAA